jgi:hypothetical protein
MKKLLWYVLEPLVTLAKYLSFRMSQASPSWSRPPSVIGLVRQNANFQSAEFIEQNLSDALLFDSREALWDFGLSKITLSGHFLEFGVYDGYSINYFAGQYPNRTVYGFDSFKGLAEDWAGTELKKGAFDLRGELPVVSSNVVLVPGWFEDTIPNFSKTIGVDVAFIHLDADTYQATSCVLSLLAKNIGAGCIMVFDEHHGYPNWQNGEFRALNEFAKRHNIRFRYLGFSEMAALIEVVDADVPS